MVQGSGDVQQRSRLISKKQIIDQLLQRPLTYEELWEETHVQRNELQDILKEFEENRFIYKHKIHKDFFGPKHNKRGRNYISYYVLNLDSESLAYEVSDNEPCEESVQQLIADPTPYYLTEYLEDYDHSSDGVLRKYGDNMINKINSLSVHVDPFYYSNQTLIEKVTHDVERKFPHIEENRQVLRDTFVKQIPEYEELIIEIKKQVTRERQSEEEKIRELKSKIVDELVGFIQNKKGSQFDFLFIKSRELYESGSEENFHNYRRIWKIIKEYNQY